MSVSFHSIGIAPARAHGAVWMLAALWCGAIVAAPVTGLDSVYAFFSAICHQAPDRSWQIAGQPLPVCIRCASIYAGFLIALSARIRPRTWLLRVALAAMGLEFIVARIGFDHAPTRSLSGLLVGLAAAGFVEIGVRELLGRYLPGRGAAPRTLEKSP